MVENRILCVPRSRLRRDSAIASASAGVGVSHFSHITSGPLVQSFWVVGGDFVGELDEVEDLGDEPDEFSCELAVRVELASELLTQPDQE